MKRTFGHEDAGAATPESLDTIIKNHDIQIFLDSQLKRYLVGPKGTGKTLLLLRKAIDQRKQGDGLCIPSTPGNPVDRLVAAEHVGLKFNYQISDASEASLAWSSVWKHAIFCSILHHVRDEILQVATDAVEAKTVEEQWTKELLTGRGEDLRRFLDSVLSNFSFVPLGPFHYFTELSAKLDTSGHKMLGQVRKEVRHMSGLLHSIRRPVYVFLDNLDDYYELQPALWMSSMYGQLRAVREITLAHKNIHVFTSIRQDVYEQFEDEMKLQYFDYVAHLKYSKDELLKIFESHIAELENDLLVRPEKRADDPWEAFFGDAVIIRNAFADIDEDIKDYIHRHTLGRPRDIIHMGTILLANSPAKAFSENDVKNAVQVASKDIAKQYLREIWPLVEDFDIGKFITNFVYSDILDQELIDQGVLDFLTHLESSGIDVPKSDCCITKPFETLFELGLLGFIRELPDSDRCLQQFRIPGQGLSQATDRALPESRFYLVHPIIHHLLPAKHSKSRMRIGNQLSVDCEVVA